MKSKIVLSNVGLLSLLILGAAYLLLSVARIDPTAKPFTVRVNLIQSGGLGATSEVTYRGARVGKVDQIRLQPGGVAVDVRIDEGTEIPADTEVAVADLSMAGEQYLDFRPRRDDGPYLGAGAVIDQRDTLTPTPFAQLMGHVNGVAKQIEPGKLDVIVTELAKAFSGTAPQLQKLLTGGDFLLAGLESVLPETVRILDNGRITLDTAAGLRDDLGRIGAVSPTLGDALRTADPEIRSLLDQSPGAFDLVDGLIRDNKPTMAALLADLGTLSEITTVRTPALAEYLPALTGLGNSLTGVVRNGALQVVADIYPRAACDYDTPRMPPTVGGSPPPRINRYCTDRGPALQQRGSYNAPRPAGDDTATIAPGSDPLARATGTPTTQASAAWLSEYLTSLRN